MMLACPSCGATYEISLDVPPEGRRVRCSRCKHIWRATPDGTKAGPAEAPAGQPEQPPQAAAVQAPRAAPPLTAMPPGPMPVGAGYTNGIGAHPAARAAAPPLAPPPLRYPGDPTPPAPPAGWQHPHSQHRTPYPPPAPAPAPESVHSAVMAPPAPTPARPMGAPTEPAGTLAQRLSDWRQSGAAVADVAQAVRPPPSRDALPPPDVMTPPQMRQAPRPLPSSPTALQRSAHPEYAHGPVQGYTLASIPTDQPASGLPAREGGGAARPQRSTAMVAVWFLVAALTGSLLQLAAFSPTTIVRVLPAATAIYNALGIEVKKERPPATRWPGT